ncbi:nucleotidyltransferase domain-containing protein [Halarchaeum sp. P4]|uniref:nucleotidyltransferase domain-containing protein n=1 Tax=Halarchaeum sp. P4 TaxID=3421639 RepID=UPI003EB85666
MAPSAPEPEPVAAALECVSVEHDVSVRVAAEVGSRAWGYAGPASDHDVGVVYAQRPPEYVVLDGYTPSIHDEYAGVDVRAWNLTRFAELLVESNPTALEFLASPTVYRTCPGAEAVREHALASFSPIDVYHHYRSLATSQHEADAPVSRRLHVVRAALYARYVLDTHEFPDPVFPDFLDAEGARFPDAWVAAARTLCDRKRAGEGGATLGDTDEDDIADVPDGLLDLPREVDPDVHAVRGVEREQVNEFVRAAFEDAYSTV